MICRDLSNIAAYAKVNNEVFKVMKRNLPGPFTFVLPATNKLPNVMINRRKTIGIRIPDNYIVMSIVEELGNPLLTTSVKAEDEVVEYMTDPELIHEKYEKLVDLVIDGGSGRTGLMAAILMLELGYASTQVKTQIQQIRPKALTSPVQVNYLIEQYAYES
jgi:tRNA threonylcarbamoyl adenosine modification protein (Sua5/YciO/YrdC/YwlC family)